MRALLGEPDNPQSAYILVIRRIYEEGYTYWQNHKRLYPTWGCLLFPDYGEVFTFRPEIVDPIIGPEIIGGKIHCLFSADYNKLSDFEIIGLVRRNFPMYSDEDDPIISDNPILDSLTEFVKKTDTNLEDVVSFAPYREVLLETIRGSAMGIEAFEKIDLPRSKFEFSAKIPPFKGDLDKLK